MFHLDTSCLTPSQLSFLECVDKYVLFSGGWGSGKSTAGIFKMLQLKCINERLAGLVTAQTYGALKANLLDPMYEIFDTCKVPRRHRPHEKNSRSRYWLQWPDGARTYLGSAETPKGYDGLSVAWEYGDECRYWTRYAWDVFQSRLRVKGKLNQIAVTSTPALNWMDEEFNSGKKNRTIIRASTYENEANLREGYIEDLKESFSARMIRAMLMGEFTPLEGAVYEDFDPDPMHSKWLIDFKPTRSYFINRKVYLTVDPGFRKSAWIFIVENAPLGASTNEPNWVVFDELMPDRKTDVECVEMVNARKLPIDEVWCDPAGDATQSLTGLDTFAALRQIVPREHGKRTIRTVGKFRSVSFGVDKLRVLLGGYSRVPRRIKFANRLVEYERKRNRGIVRDLAKLSYPEKEGRPISDEPLKDGVCDHSHDALRYWGVGRWLCEPILRRKDPTLRNLQGPLHNAA